ncbi:sucrase ferredoxin domain-containing protein [Diaporthe amygdali]|uniref:sucrase ferredoxin domain-containing protein n=1 Tax=Phomopsis amygdali TaxID=1214568 RepID=UPI0022FE5A59|nr:sucrase ferredoxin domain-containing protein [Diaporthe amygdali]KAJ0120837.1 sucrase ferredoxin domain-containing protein [Diaporthe amygdali]
MSALHIIFRVIYDSFYVFLSLIVLLLLLVTPADNVRLALQNHQGLHVLTTVICLSVTLLFVVLLYFARLYVNRSALANIPKPWIPIGKGEVKKSVRKMITAGLSRSAAIAYESKPRVAPARPPTAMTEVEEGEKEEKAGDKGRKSALKVFKLKKAPTVEDKMGITLPPHRAVWGEIEHYGWASPNSFDLPNLQYSSVISELPNLIEAKALTLAPPVPDKSHTQPPILDPEAIGLLQRPDNLALRQYLTQLAELGVLTPSRTTADFLSAYEYARYSTRPISNARFRELMHLFAELLRTMQPLDPAVLMELDGAGLSEDEESDIDDDAPRRSPPSTPRSRASRNSVLQRQRSTASHATTTTTSSGKSNASGGSQVRRRPRNHQQQPRPQMAGRVSSQGTSWGGGAATYRTAPTTPKTQKTAASPSPTASSVNSFAQTRQPFTLGGGGSSASTSSVASAHVSRSRSGRSSVASGSGGSVIIRLAGRADGDGMPYVLSLGGDSDR